MQSVQQFTGKYVDSDLQKKSKKQKQKKKPGLGKIIMNVSDTQYSVVKYLGKKVMGWVLEYSHIENLSFDVCWTDNSVKPEMLSKMQPHQKINHFPGMSVLSRKNNLGRNLMKLRKHEPSEYGFFPMTFLLPNDYLELKCYNMNRKEGKAQTFIVKPQASCQGRGIYLTRNVQKIKNEKCVVQRYLHKPFLLDQLKFDLRIYVLLTGLDPLRIFVYEEGLVRLATEPYVPPKNTNLEQICMHLTNYAINKQSPNFQYNQSSQKMDVGHKRSLTYLYTFLKQKGHDVKKLKHQINDLIIKTFISGHPSLTHSYKNCQPTNFRNNMCFELLGFDIILDYKLNPILLEINYTPSFTTDTPLDTFIKKNVINDALHLLNVNEKTKLEAKADYDREVKERLMSAKRKKYTDQERYQLIDKLAYKRDVYELQNLGRFSRIYPTSQSQIQEYSRFFDLAYECIDPNTNTLYPSQKFKKKTGKLYYQPQFQIPAPRAQSSLKPKKKKVLKTKRQADTLSIPKSPKYSTSKPKNIKNSFCSTKEIHFNNQAINLPLRKKNKFLEDGSSQPRVNNLIDQESSKQYNNKQ